MNIKNPLFTLMADFFVFSGEFGAGRGMDVLLRWLWEWQGLLQREGQARSPTKSEWDSADAKPTKHTQMLTIRKASGIVRFWKGWCERGIVRKWRLLWGDVDAGTVK